MQVATREKPTEIVVHHPISVEKVEEIVIQTVIANLGLFVGPTTAENSIVKQAKVQIAA